MLTKKQKDFFEKLKKEYGKDILPSFEIIAKRFGFRHRNSVWQYFNKFREENLIFERDKRFLINREFFGAIKLTSHIRAGFASVGEDGIDRRVSLDETFKIDSPTTFMFTVVGDSMVGLGVFEGDTVIIEKTPEVRIGDMVLAFTDGGFTLKTYRKDKDGIYLEPANPAYPNIRPKEHLEIFGKVKGVVRKV